MAGAFVVVRTRRTPSGRTTIDAFGPYPRDMAEKARERAELIERTRPALSRGVIGVVQLEARVTDR